MVTQRHIQSSRLGKKPDVLGGMESEDYLFVGDAKDFENEDSSNSPTVQRIQGYFFEFAGLLGNLGYKGGILAIAANSSEAASDWVVTLNALANAAGIRSSNGEDSNFTISESGLI